LAVFLYGKGIHAPDEKGQRVEDNSFYLMFNAHFEPITFTIPNVDAIKGWRKVIGTAQLMRVGEEAQPHALVLPDEEVEGGENQTLEPGQEASLTETWHCFDKCKELALNAETIEKEMAKYGVN
jgi:hypothetical protein